MYVTVSEAATMLGVTESRVRQMVKAGKLVRHQIDGRTYGVVAASVAAVIAERRGGRDG